MTFGAAEVQMSGILSQVPVNYAKTPENKELPLLVEYLERCQSSKSAEPERRLPLPGTGPRRQRAGVPLPLYGALTTLPARIGHRQERRFAGVAAQWPVSVACRQNSRARASWGVRAGIGDCAKSLTFLVTMCRAPHARAAATCIASSKSAIGSEMA